MRIAIVGAGAVGGFLAAGLSDRGHRITLVARAKTAEALNRDGLLMRDREDSVRRFRLPAVTTLSERADLVLLTVKTQDLAQACRDIQPCLQGAPVVTLQNGVRADRIAAAVLGRDAVIGGVVMCAATCLQPGEVTVHFPGWLIVGEPFRAAGARTHTVVRALGGAVPVYLTHHIRRVRWSKLITNLNNGICAATGLTLPELGGTSLGRTLSVRVMKEGCEVARAAGVRLDHGLYGLTPRSLRRHPSAALISLLQASMASLLGLVPERAAVGLLGAAGRSGLNQLPIHFSTWQSIVRGRASEIEYLNGEIVRSGARSGLPTPYNTRVVAAVHEVERSGVFCRLEELLPPGHTHPETAPRMGESRCTR